MLIQVAARALCVLALDRFGDFASRDGAATAPVRAGAAQLVALLLAPRPSRDSDERLTRARALCDAANTLARAPRWEARHGAMLLLEYSVALLVVDVAASGGTDDAQTCMLRTARALAARALRCTEDVNSDDVRSGAARVLITLPPSDDESPSASTACGLLVPLEVARA